MRSIGVGDSCKNYWNLSYSAYSPSRRLDLMRVHATLRDVNNCSLRGSTSDPGSTRDPGSNRDPVLLLYKDGNTIDMHSFRIEDFENF